MFAAEENWANSRFLLLAIRVRRNKSRSGGERETRFCKELKGDEREGGEVFVLCE